ncbi:hypothetical protein R3P38DRAFT_3215998 [Favolaschia claudopus]|uniref:Uncharacterized protein n=1 Tax=Favolaschia claudopus TaxID=2862362 RepID=A0AAW0A6J5_9AGAR
MPFRRDNETHDDYTRRLAEVSEADLLDMVRKGEATAQEMKDWWAVHDLLKKAKAEKAAEAEKARRFKMAEALAAVEKQRIEEERAKEEARKEKERKKKAAEKAAEKKKEKKRDRESSEEVEVEEITRCERCVSDNAKCERRSGGRASALRTLRWQEARLFVRSEPREQEAANVGARSSAGVGARSWRSSHDGAGARAGDLQQPLRGAHRPPLAAHGGDQRAPGQHCGELARSSDRGPTDGAAVGGDRGADGGGVGSGSDDDGPGGISGIGDDEEEEEDSESDAEEKKKKKTEESSSGSDSDSEEEEGPVYGPVEEPDALGEDEETEAGGSGTATGN